MVDILIKATLDATAPPTATDDTNAGYSVFSPWVDITNDDVYFALDVTATAAIWVQISGPAYPLAAGVVRLSTEAGFAAVQQYDGTDWQTVISASIKFP